MAVILSKYEKKFLKKLLGLPLKQFEEVIRTEFDIIDFSQKVDKREKRKSLKKYKIKINPDSVIDEFLKRQKK